MYIFAKAMTFYKMFLCKLKGFYKMCRICINNNDICVIYTINVGDFMKTVPMLLTIAIKADSDIVDTISLNSGQIKNSLGFERVEAKKNHIEFCESDLYPRIIVDNKNFIITMPNTNVINELTRSNYDVLQAALSSFELLEKNLIIEKLNLTGIIEEFNKSEDIRLFFNKEYIKSVKSLNKATVKLDYYNTNDEHINVMMSYNERCWVDLGLSKIFRFKDIDEKSLNAIVNNMEKEIEKILGV